MILQIAVLLLSFCLRGSAQCPYYFDHLTTQENLSQSSVFAIIQDKNGFIWFGTQAGLDRYDGISFKNFTTKEFDKSSISPGYVNSLYEDTVNHLMYVGTTRGFSKISLTNDNRIQRIYLEKEEKNYNIISIKGIGNDRFWVIANGKLFAHENNDFYEVKFARSGNDLLVNDFIYDSTKNVGYVATSSGIFMLDLSKNIILGHFDIQFQRLSVSVNKLALWNGNLVAANNSNAFILNIPTISNRNNSLTVNDELKYKDQITGEESTVKRCANIIVDFHNQLWIGTDKSGLLRFSQGVLNGEQILRDFKRKESLTSSYILSLCQSRDSTLWIGTNGGGINKLVFQRPEFLSYFQEHKGKNFIPNNDVWSIYQLNGDSVLLGSDGNGVLMLSRKKDSITHFRIKGKDEVNIVRALTGNKGIVYVGTDSGLFRVSVRNIVNYDRYPLINNIRVNYLYLTSEYLWIGTENSGLLQYVVKQKKIITHKFQEAITSLDVDIKTNDIFVGTVRGLYRLRQNSGSYILRDSAMLSTFVTTILVQEENIWVGTRKDGLYSLNSNSLKIQEHHNSKTILPDDVIYGILPDDSGQIWCSSNKGIFCFNAKNNVLNYYNNFYGLQQDEFNTGAYHKARKGDSVFLYFGGVNGLNIILPRPIFGYNCAGIGGLLVNKDENLVEFYPLGTQTIEINPRLKKLIIDVRLFHFQDSRNNKYRYRLHDETFSQAFATSEPIRINRSKLYLFKDNKLELQVCTSNGVWRSYSIINLKVPFDHIDQARPLLAIIAFIICLMLFFLWNRQRKARIQKNKIEIINQGLAKQTSELMALQDHINEISRTETTKEAVSLALGLLTDQEDTALFNFDYATFSMADQVKKRLIIGPSKIKTGFKGEPAKWKELCGEILLDSSDVMAQAIALDKMIEVRGEEIIDAPSATLNKEVFHKFGHGSYARLFIPVKARHKEIKGGDKPMGLLEVGCATLEKIFHDDLKIKLTLYADNLGQVYKRLGEKETDLKILRLLEKSDSKSGDDPRSYLENILKGINSLIQSDFAGIALLPSRRSELIEENIIVRNEEIAKDGLQLIPQLFTFDSTITGKTEVRKSRTWKRSTKSFSSLSIPVIYNDRLLATADFIKLSPSFFTEEIVSVTEKTFRKVGEGYINKKFLKAVEDLVSLENIVSTQNSMTPLINLLEDFFRTDWVSFWTRDYSREGQFYKRSFYSNALKEEGAAYPFTISEEDLTIEDLEPVKWHNIDIIKNQKLYDFLNEKNLPVIIAIPLSIEGRIHGFIHIYSRRHWGQELLSQEKQFLELLSAKTVMTHVIVKMIRGFSIISESLVSKDQTTVFQQITDEAREILVADPVILFSYQENNALGKGYVVHSGKLFHQSKLTDGQSSSFIEKVIQDRKDVLISKEGELPDYYPKENKTDSSYKDRFWHREGIKSAALIPLFHERKPIGIMCFNFRQPQDFSPTTHSLIRAFSSLAAIALNNADNVAHIKFENINLGQQTKDYQTKHDIIKVQLEDLLPTAKGSSLMEIVRAVNHDIRNHLSRVRANLKDVKADVNIPNQATRVFFDQNLELISGDIENSENLIALFEPNSFSVSIQNVFDIVKQVQQLFTGKYRRDKNDIEINASLLTPNMPDMRCSKAEISMVVYNLVSNAVTAIGQKVKRKESKEKGKIDIQVGMNSEKYYVITVEDNGIGIDNSIGEQIFEIGYTTRDEIDNKGLGIGLYFVKATVENLYRGDISFKSYVNVGTTFIIKLKQHA